MEVCACSGVSELWRWYWDEWDGDCCSEAWWWCALACSVLYLCMLPGAARQPLLLLQRWQHLLWAALCGTSTTPMCRLWWGTEHNLWGCLANWKRIGSLLRYLQWKGSFSRH